MLKHSKYFDMKTGAIDFSLNRTSRAVTLILTLWMIIAAGECNSQQSKPYSPNLIEMKVYYFRNLRSEMNDGFNVIQLVPKLTFLHSRINLYLPVGIFQELVYDQPLTKESRVSMFISPRITAGLYRKDQFDIFIGAYSEFILPEDRPTGSFFGITSGIVYFNETGNTYIRLETGIDMPGATGHPVNCSAGITIGYRIATEKSHYRTASYNPSRFLASMTKMLDFVRRRF